MDDRAKPPEDIEPEDFFCRWVPERVAADPDRRGRLPKKPAGIEFTLVGEGGGVFGVILENGAARGTNGKLANPDLRVRVSVRDWRDLNAGRLAAPRALLERRIHLSGDLGLALKLHLVLG